MAVAAPRGNLTSKPKNDRHSTRRDPMSALGVATQPRALRFRLAGPIAGDGAGRRDGRGRLPRRGRHATRRRPRGDPLRCRSCMGQTPRTPRGAAARAAATSNGLTAYRGLVADIKVAESQHDRRALIRIRQPDARTPDRRDDRIDLPGARAAAVGSRSREGAGRQPRGREDQPSAGQPVQHEGVEGVSRVLQLEPAPSSAGVQRAG